MTITIEDVLTLPHFAYYKVLYHIIVWSYQVHEKIDVMFDNGSIYANEEVQTMKVGDIIVDKGKDYCSYYRILKITEEAIGINYLNNTDPIMFKKSDSLFKRAVLFKP